MKKHIYPYSYEKYLIESFNDYLYSILGYTNIELYNMKAFATRNCRVYSMNLLKSFIKKSKLYKFLIANFRLMINAIDLNCLKVYENDYYDCSYITSDIITIEENRLNILSSSYISTKYLFNFAKKEYLYSIIKKDNENQILYAESIEIHHYPFSVKDIYKLEESGKLDSLSTIRAFEKYLVKENQFVGERIHPCNQSGSEFLELKNQIKIHPTSMKVPLREKDIIEASITILNS